MKKWKRLLTTKSSSVRRNRSDARMLEMKMFLHSVPEKLGKRIIARNTVRGYTPGDKDYVPGDWTVIGYRSEETGELVLTSSSSSWTQLHCYLLWMVGALEHINEEIEHCKEDWQVAHVYSNSAEHYHLPPLVDGESMTFGRIEPEVWDADLQAWHVLTVNCRRYYAITFLDDELVEQGNLPSLDPRLKD